MLTDDLELQRGLSTRSFVNVEQAAALLRVSRSAIRRRCRSGQLPAIRSGREWQVELAAIRELVNGQLRQAGR